MRFEDPDGDLRGPHGPRQHVPPDGRRVRASVPAGLRAEHVADADVLDLVVLGHPLTLRPFARAGAPEESDDLDLRRLDHRGDGLLPRFRVPRVHVWSVVETVCLLW